MIKYLICELANSHNGNANTIFSLLRKIEKIKYKNLGLKFQVISKKDLANSVGINVLSFCLIFLENCSKSEKL